MGVIVRECKLVRDRWMGVLQTDQAGKRKLTRGSWEGRHPPTSQQLLFNIKTTAALKYSVSTQFSQSADTVPDIGHFSSGIGGFGQTSSQALKLHLFETLSTE